MHRIDGPNYAPGNLFTEGDPLVPTPATVVTDDWLNDVQENIAQAIEGAGTTGFGSANSFGEVEVYTVARFWKVG